MEGATGLVWIWVGSMTLLALTVPTSSGNRNQSEHLKDIVEHSEIIEPHWLGDFFIGMEAGGKYPEHAELLVKAEGQDLILSLHRNEQFIHPNYRETHYSLNYTRVVRTPNMTEHCYYHGIVQEQDNSSVVISICSGIRGMITLSNNLSYIVEPLPGEDGRHVIYKAEHLGLSRICHGHSIHFEEKLPTLTSNLSGHHSRVRRENVEGERCVELYLVADYAEFQKHDSDLEETQRKMLEVMNYIDKFYRALNIRIALVGLEVWTAGDKCNVSENPYSTLRAFLSWRRKLLQHTPHDNAQLITGRSFYGTTIGLAPLQAMCSVYQSGGVNMDHSDNAIGVAATMAHELGHNFGMSHDAAGCCTAKPEEGGCIMAASTGHPFPKVFNACNKQELDRFFRSGGGMCLSNLPDTKTLFGGPRCGNGFLEEGEQCDCGDPEQCNNPCCNATTCTLMAGADCAHGACCLRCKLRPPGFPCRKPSRPCDLPEFCTGQSAVCPPNSFQLDGTLCQGEQAFCYNGRCLTHQQQCQQLWGARSRVAPDLCFELINVAGDQYGNCGRDMSGTYRSCEGRDVMCGKIQCLSQASKPMESNAVAIDTTITIEGKRVQCRGTHIYKEEDDLMDPGLVLTGTKCGLNQICFDGQCRNTSFLQVDECAKKCHGNGMCNNNRNCHCFAGWRPPFCNQTGNGGSIDSGPVPEDGSLALVLWICIPLALLAGMALSLAMFFYVFRIRGRQAKTESCPATCPLHKSDSPTKHGVGSTSKQRPQVPMQPKSPPVLYPTLRVEKSQSAASQHHQEQPEGGAAKYSSAISHHSNQDLKGGAGKILHGVSYLQQGGAIKTGYAMRTPPPNRPAPPPPALAPTPPAPVPPPPASAPPPPAPKRLERPRRLPLPPPVPPNRTRRKAMDSSFSGPEGTT
ncbi:disintegrin and metalloproteinase domain-containing protein 19 precursor [Xenopus tropicalis]|uniref:ADAM19 n=1 Tax=Xenopus tropicalis TaxID=8364 RepID=Q27JK5_XENTR|nr:disintegrin and metalloproteinase domain-containing protein 19 precursor [Xenopus tropicalis]ABD52384.1 ADAM19 [Xenopus tropicalis]|eukprot:NP_001035105.1 disintegrin and metalloproteinase domain-containing protein 19 precursor [Xenopus tropicalis]